MEHISLSTSLNKVNTLSFDDHIEWLDKELKLNNQSAIFYFNHLQKFISLYGNKLNYKSYVYKEKLYQICLELKQISLARMLLKDFMIYFGVNEQKVQMLKADFEQIVKITDVDNNYNNDQALSLYKKLILADQNDRKNMKNFILLKKSDYSYQELKFYIELLNEYLKVYMDDPEIWEELADVYIMTLNYNKALFCLEEVLIYTPNNYLIYCKIGDMLNSFNNTDFSLQGLKYYSKSLLIKESARAFWGIIYICNTFKKYKKQIEGQLKESLTIAINKLNKIHGENYVERLYGKLN